ncbi:MAG: MBL fold metallo-hydrolase [Tissierellia bacterium]|nr:MBL fold metallo-hydrolase [Tissierellia bacterium]
MKMITLIENQPGDREDLHTEHGLSIYLEVDGKNILFDTGQSGKFIENARDLNVDLKNLDYVIISHGHYDHGEGLQHLIREINPDIELYIGNGFFDKKYKLEKDGSYKYISNPFDEEFLKENNIPIRYVEEDILYLTENLFIFTNFNRDGEYENMGPKMYIKENDSYKKDMFFDEISIGIKTDKGLVIIVGCSHPGVVNILDTIIQNTGMDVYALIGGTHLVDEDEAKIDKVIEYLNDKDIDMVGACHCTGEKGLAMLEEQLGDRFFSNNTGSILEI